MLPAALKVLAEPLSLALEALHGLVPTTSFPLHRPPIGLSLPEGAMCSPSRASAVAPPDLAPLALQAWSSLSQPVVPQRPLLTSPGAHGAGLGRLVTVSATPSSPCRLSDQESGPSIPWWGCVYIVSLAPGPGQNQEGSRRRLWGG